MAYVPTPHQVEDSDLMLEYKDAFLWAAAGTGKTVTAMEAFRKGEYEKVVVLCPRLAITMWGEEFRSHIGEDFRYVSMKTGRIPKASSGPLDADCLITTFDLAIKHSNLIRDFCNGGKGPMRGVKPRSVLILDEAHMIKTRGAKRTRAIFGPTSNGMGGIYRYFDDVWQLTGTPVLRHVDDLWSQLRAARPDILAHYGVLSYDAFVNEFCTITFRKFGAGPTQKVVTGSTNLEKLDELLKACKVIKRKLADVVDDLPPITHRVLEVDYKGVDNPSVNTATLMKELADGASEMSTIRRKLGVAKALSVAHYAADLGAVPLLIGYWHTAAGEAIVEALHELHPEWTVSVVSGKTSANQRDLIREGFNAGAIDVVVGQMQAMGTSWNLQEMCSNVIIAEELVSPGMLHQFFSRVYRRGQKRHVQVDHLRSTHNLDRAMVQIRDKKETATEELGL